MLKGDEVLVVGLGSIGILTAQALKAYGAKVTGCDLIPERIEILKSFKHLVELYPEEKGEMNNYPNEFLTMTLENKNFQKLINIKKEEINKYSRIHGTNNKETIQEDENSSQASQSGFNDDLCKRNRIEEIRANTLKSISI